MDIKIREKIENNQLKKRPEIKAGDSVKVHLKIKEGNKERIQIFAGIVLSLKGSGLDRTMTVRKISFGVGVEKIFPLHSPSIEKIEVVKRGKVRKSKLYYMRKRIGKRALKIGGIKDVYMTDEVEEVPAEVVVEEVKEEPKEESKEEPKKE